jgi:hypothetical protein
MSFISEAHSQWHAINGRWGCPLDCAMSDAGIEAEIGEGSHSSGDVVAVVEGREFTTWSAARFEARRLAREFGRSVVLHRV